MVFKAFYFVLLLLVWDQNLNHQKVKHPNFLGNLDVPPPFFLPLQFHHLILSSRVKNKLKFLGNRTSCLQVSCNGLERYQNNSYNITSNHKTHQFNEFVFKLIYNKRITPKMLMGFLRYFHSLCSLSISTISSRIIKWELSNDFVSNPFSNPIRLNRHCLTWLMAPSFGSFDTSTKIQDPNTPKRNSRNNYLPGFQIGFIFK